MFYLVRTNSPLNSAVISLNINVKFDFNDKEKYLKELVALEPLKKAVLESNIKSTCSIKVDDYVLILRSEFKNMCEIAKVTQVYCYDEVNQSHIIRVKEIQTMERNNFSREFQTSLRKPRVAYPITKGVEELNCIIGLNPNITKLNINNEAKENEDYVVEFPISNTSTSVKLVIPNNVDVKQLNKTLLNIHDFLETKNRD